MFQQSCEVEMHLEQFVPRCRRPLQWQTTLVRHSGVHINLKHILSAAFGRRAEWYREIHILLSYYVKLLFPHRSNSTNTDSSVQKLLPHSTSSSPDVCGRRYCLQAAVVSFLRRSRVKATFWFQRGVLILVVSTLQTRLIYTNHTQLWSNPTLVD